MKQSIPMIIVLLIFAVLFSGCPKKRVLESGTELYKDYKKLEDTLTQTKSFPNQALNDRFAAFLEKYDWTGDFSRLPDGTYEAFSTPDMYDYVHFVRFSVVSGRVTEVYYDEFIPGAEIGKREDAAYSEEMSPLTKITSAESYPVFEQQLLVTQDPMKVDAVSGATLSTWRFRIVVLKAISEFRTGRILGKEFHTWKEK